MRTRPYAPSMEFKGVSFASPVGAPFATGADGLCMKAVFSHPAIKGAWAACYDVARAISRHLRFLRDMVPLPAKQIRSQAE